MAYYAIEQDGNIVGIASSEDLLRFGRSGNIMTANAQTAEFIQCGQAAYHADWMRFPSISVTLLQAEVNEIDEDTYNSYMEAIEAGQEILSNIAEDKDTTVTEESSETETAAESTATSAEMPTTAELLKIISQLSDRISALEGGDTND